MIQTSGNFRIQNIKGQLYGLRNDLHILFIYLFNS